MATRVVDGQLEPQARAPLLFGVEGELLTQVEFFGLDGASVLLHFGGARLEVLSKAVVRQDGAEVPAGGEAGRAALRACLHSAVRHLVVDGGRELALEFENGVRLSVSLAAADRTGPDAAVFFDDAWRYEPY